MKQEIRIAQELIRVAKSLIAIDRKEKNKELFDDIYNAFDNLEEEVREHGNESSMKTFLTNLFGTKDFKVDNKNEFISKLQEAIIGNHLEQADNKLSECNQKSKEIIKTMMDKYEAMKKEYEQDKDYKTGGYYKEYKQKYENYKKDVNNYFSSKKEVTTILNEAIKEINMLLNGSLKEIPDDAKKVLSKGIEDFKKAVESTRENIKKHYYNILTGKDNDVKSLMNNIYENDIKEQEENKTEKNEAEKQKQESEQDAALVFKKYAENEIQNTQSVAKSKLEQAEAAHKKYYDDFINNSKKLDDKEKEKIKEYANQIWEVEKKKFNDLINKYNEDTKAGKITGKNIRKEFDNIFDNMKKYSDADVQKIMDEAKSNGYGQYIHAIDTGQGNEMDTLKSMGEWIESRTEWVSDRIVRNKEKAKNKEKYQNKRIATAKKLIALAKALIIE